MTRALVSVVIPAYNAGPFITEALQSVLGQTYSNLEVIVVDDGSTDDTRERVAAFGGRVTLIPQANSGAAVARNTGIRYSHGTYLAFLDADDVWLPNKVARLVEALERSADAGAAYHGYVAMEETGAVVGQPVIPAHDGDVLQPLLLGCFFGPPMVMIPRACLNRVGGFDPDLKLGEDWDLFLRIALAGLPIRRVPEVLVRCRAHRMNTTRDLARTAVFGRIVLDRTFADPRLPARLLTQRFRIAAYKTHAIFQAGRCLRAGLWPDGVELFLEAARLDPRMLSHPSSYLDLALRTLPLADQTWPALARHADQATALLTNVLDGVFRSSGLPVELARQKRPAWSALWMTIAVVQALARRYSVATATSGRAFVTDPLTVAAALARAGTGRWMSIPCLWRPVRAAATERT